MLIENPKLIKLWKDLAYHKKGSLLWLSPLLLPASILYGGLQSVRRGLYNLGVLKGNKSNLPVISVGNITVGGVGKTPFALYLAIQLKEMGYTPAILFRGYKRNGDKAVILTQDNFRTERIMEYGDEPAMVCFTSGIPCGIHAKRSKTAQLLIDQNLCDILIMDDGLQHLQLQRDLDIVLLDGVNAVGNRRYLPAGPLREPINTLTHANAVVFRDETNFDILPEAYAGQVFEGELHWSGICPFAGWMQCSYTSETPINSYHFQSVILVSGIGNPERLEHQAISYGLDVQHHAMFSDHHWITWDEIVDAGETKPSLPLLLTEKDAIRLIRMNTDVPDELMDRLFVIRAKWCIKQNNEFMDWLKQTLQHMK